MAMILMDGGATQILNSYFKKVNAAGGPNLTLKLFVNDINPADTDTAVSYVEAVGGGYAAKVLTPSMCILGTAPIRQMSYPQELFIFTGPLTANLIIYGAYIVDDDGVLISAEKAAATYTPTYDGDVYTVTPIFKLGNGTVI